MKLQKRKIYFGLRFCYFVTTKMNDKSMNIFGIVLQYFLGFELMDNQLILEWTMIYFLIFKTFLLSKILLFYFVYNSKIVFHFYFEFNTFHLKLTHVLLQQILLLYIIVLLQILLQYITLTYYLLVIFDPIYAQYKTFITILLDVCHQIASLILRKKSIQK